MKSSVGDLVLKHYFENLSICTYTLDIVRKSSKLLHRVKVKLQNSAEIENPNQNSTLLIPINQFYQCWTTDVEVYQK